MSKKTSMDNGNDPLVNTIMSLCIIAGIYRGTENLTLQDTKHIAETAISELMDSEEYRDLVLSLLVEVSHE